MRLMDEINRIGSPCNAEFLLWCHYSPIPHPRLNSIAITKALNYFLRLGVIKPHETKEDVWRTTKLGAAWVLAMCNTSIPEVKSVFVDEFGNILEV